MNNTDVEVDDGAFAVKVLLWIAACVVFPPIAAFFMGWYAVVFLLWVLRSVLTVFFTAVHTHP